MTIPRYNPSEIGTFDVNETLTTSANSGEANVGENAVQIDDFVKDDWNLFSCDTFKVMGYFSSVN